jgi:RimJ/RimL family protein N-acetyltransferase
MARRVRARHDRGAWLVVSDGEVVGLCSYKNAPDPDGKVEIGFGIAASRRRQGHATRAVTALLAIAGNDPPVRMLFAETSIANVASQRVLEKSGFTRVGSRTHKEDGDLLLWRRDVGDSERAGEMENG